MKVCMVTATYLPYQEYGAERAVRLLAGGLRRGGCDVRVVTTCPAGQDRVERVDDHDVAYVSQRNGYWSGDRETKSTLAKVAWHVRDTYNPAMQAAVGRMLDDWRPDVVHTHILAGFSVAAWHAARRRDIPIVHTIHDYYLLCPRSSMFVGRAACGGQCFACRVLAVPRCRATGLVDAVTAPSAAVLSAHLGRGLFRRAAVKDVVQYVVPPAEPPAAGGPRHGVVVGFLGRLTPDKGVHLLLDWFTGAVGSRHGDWRLLVAGTGPLEQQVREACASDPRVEYLGYSAPDDFFPRITALVVPSIWHDPSPVVIREAYARGIPVAGSVFGGIPELIRLVDDRLIFDPREAADMTRVIGLVTAREEQPGLRSRSLDATVNFAATRICPEMERIYHSCVGGRERHAER
jgi:glycosyltransferase involved in cell wall biosynthesis